MECVDVSYLCLPAQRQVGGLKRSPKTMADERISCAVSVTRVWVFVDEIIMFQTFVILQERLAREPRINLISQLAGIGEGLHPPQRRHLSARLGGSGKDRLHPSALSA